MIEAFKLRGRATALGYVRGPSEDGGWFYRYVKVFPSLGLQAVVGFSGNGMPEEIAPSRSARSRSSARARGVRFASARSARALQRSVERHAGDISRAGTGFDPAWESKVS